MRSNIFLDLFVLELANNHWGQIKRGLKIIDTYAKLSNAYGIKASIKLQIRDVDHFIHNSFKHRKDIRYIKKTLDTRLSKPQIQEMVEAIKGNGLIPMATPFDEASVDFCEELNLPCIKIASSDINDWVLINKIAFLKKPTIVSTGGALLSDIDAIVDFFEGKKIPLAINHCVSLYPCPNANLEINQIDFLKHRYPNNEIGFSTHECEDWISSITLAYAKGARTFERHIDIDDKIFPVSPYCSLPNQIEKWFQAYQTAVEMCGGASQTRRSLPMQEISYLDNLVRGIYLKHPAQKGHVLNHSTIYFSIPLLKGQLSCREWHEGCCLVSDLEQDAPLMINDLNYPWDPSLKSMILNRGLEL